MKSLVFRVFALITVLFLTVFSLDNVFERRENPNSYGRFYANYSDSLENIDYRIAYRWFAPTVAHYLGFRGGKSWVNFTMFFYVFGSGCLFFLVYRLTKQTGLALVVSLIPTSTVAAHFSKWLPGYPDWILVGLPFLVFLLRSRLLFAVCCAACIWSHERALFIWVFIPFFRTLAFTSFEKNGELFRDFFRRFPVFTLNLKQFRDFLLDIFEEHEMLIWDYLIVIVVTVSYFGLRGVFSPADTLHTLKFYLDETMNGSIYAQNANGPTLSLFVRCYLEALKFLWIPFLGALAVIGWKNRNDGLLEVTFYVVCSIFIGLQLFVAIDSVRLLDFLNFPIVFAITRALYLLEMRWQKWALAGVVISAMVFNHCAPVTYIDVNGEFLIWEKGLSTPWVDSP